MKNENLRWHSITSHHWSSCFHSDPNGRGQGFITRPTKTDNTPTDATAPPSKQSYVTTQSHAPKIVPQAKKSMKQTSFMNGLIWFILIQGAA